MSVIGELLLRIGVDPSSWSQLQSTLDEGKSSVTSFGDAITATGQAMDSGFASSLSGVTSSMSALASATDPVKDAQDALRQAFADSGVSMDTLQSSSAALGQALQEMGVDAGAARDPIAGAGDAAGAAAGGMGDLGDAAGGAAPNIKEVGSSAEEAESGLRSMAEQLTAIGEALVITEGLKEFGTEALTAAGTVQSVTIGLTALTGSADKANEIVTQIKELAATEPFAFPEIAPTIQKMVAMGVSAEQINTTMHALADVSAATGNSFESVAQRLDMMSLSGIANARSMNALALSLPQLGEAMNSLGFAAGDAGKDISAAFKALDQADRIAVLDQALSKFAGAAEAEAQGITGQWIIFQTKFEEVMIAVGNAIAPEVAEILAFSKAVLSGVQSAVEAFDTLPGPVKETVVVLGLMAAAAVPITAGLAALGIGLDGVAALFVRLGIAEAEEADAAVANTAAHVTATAALAAEGIAAEGAAVGVGAAGVASGEAAVAVEGVGLAATGGAAAVVLLAGAFAATQIPVVVGQVKELSGTFGGLWQVVDDSASPLEAAKSLLFEMSINANSMDGNASTLTTTWNSLVDGIKTGTHEFALGATGFGAIEHAMSGVNLVAGTLTDVLSEMTGKWAALPAPLQAVLTHLADVNLKLTQSGSDVANASVSVSAGVQKIVDEVNKQNTAVQNATAVYNSLKTALTDSDGAMKTFAVLADGTIVTAQTLADAHRHLATAIQAATDATKGHTAASQADKDSYAAVNKEATALIVTNDAARATYVALSDAQDGSVQKALALQIAMDNLTKSTDSLNKFQITQVTSSDAVAAATQAIHDKVTEANTALETAIQTYNGIRQAMIDGTASQGEYNLAWNALLTAFKNANPEMATAKGNIADVGAAAMKAAQADDSWTGSHGNLITVIKGGITTQVQVADAMGKIADGAGAASAAAGSLGMQWGLMDVTIQDGSGTISNVVQTLKNLDAAGLGATASVGSLGMVLTNTGKDFADAYGNLQPFLQGVKDLGRGALETASDIDIWDTSMIKVDKSTTDVTAATKAANDGMVTINGTVVSLTDVLKKLASSYDDVAASAKKATDAENAKVTSGSNDSSGSLVGSSFKFSPTDQGNYQSTGLTPPGNQYVFNPTTGKWQQMAGGGIVTSPTLALIGESGPEAVIPLNGTSPDLLMQGLNAPPHADLPAGAGGSGTGGSVDFGTVAASVTTAATAITALGAASITTAAAILPTNTNLAALATNADLLVKSLTTFNSGMSTLESGVAAMAQPGMTAAAAMVAIATDAGALAQPLGAIDNAVLQLTTDAKALTTAAGDLDTAEKTVITDDGNLVKALGDLDKITVQNVTDISGSSGLTGALGALDTAVVKDTTDIGSSSAGLIGALAELDTGIVKDTTDIGSGSNGLVGAFTALDTVIGTTITDVANLTTAIGQLGTGAGSATSGGGSSSSGGGSGTFTPAAGADPNSYAQMADPNTGLMNGATAQNIAQMISDYGAKLAGEGQYSHNQDALNQALDNFAATLGAIKVGTRTYDTPYEYNVQLAASGAIPPGGFPNLMSQPGTGPPGTPVGTPGVNEFFAPTAPFAPPTPPALPYQQPVGGSSIPTGTNVAEGQPPIYKPGNPDYLVSTNGGLTWSDSGIPYGQTSYPGNEGANTSSSFPTTDGTGIATPSQPTFGMQAAALAGVSLGPTSNSQAWTNITGTATGWPGFAWDAPPGTILPPAPGPTFNSTGSPSVPYQSQPYDTTLPSNGSGSGVTQEQMSQVLANLPGGANNNPQTNEPGDIPSTIWTAVEDDLNGIFSWTEHPGFPTADETAAATARFWAEETQGAAGGTVIPFSSSQLNATSGQGIVGGVPTTQVASSGTGNAGVPSPSTSWTPGIPGSGASTNLSGPQTYTNWSPSQIADIIANLPSTVPGIVGQPIVPANFQSPPQMIVDPANLQKYQGGPTTGTPTSGTQITVNLPNAQVSSMTDAGRLAGVVAQGIRAVVKL